MYPARYLANLAVAPASAGESPCQAYNCTLAGSFIQARLFPVLWSAVLDEAAAAGVQGCTAAWSGLASDCRCWCCVQRHRFSRHQSVILIGAPHVVNPMAEDFVSRHLACAVLPDFPCMRSDWLLPAAGASGRPDCTNTLICSDAECTRLWHLLLRPCMQGRQLPRQLHTCQISATPTCKAAHRRLLACCKAASFLPTRCPACVEGDLRHLQVPLQHGFPAARRTRSLSTSHWQGHFPGQGH